MAEPELNLADLINIEDEPSGQDNPVSASGSLLALPALQNPSVLGEVTVSQVPPSPVPDPSLILVFLHSQV